MLFAIWSDGAHRPARDVDLLGFGLADNEELKAIFVELCGLETEPDGRLFKVIITGSGRKRLHTLKLHIHLGDRGEPCATIILPKVD